MIGLYFTTKGWHILKFWGIVQIYKNFENLQKLWKFILKRVDFFVEFITKLRLIFEKWKYQKRQSSKNFFANFAKYSKGHYFTLGRCKNVKFCDIVDLSKKFEKGFLSIELLTNAMLELKKWPEKTKWQFQPLVYRKANAPASFLFDHITHINRSKCLIFVKLKHIGQIKYISDKFYWKLKRPSFYGG